MDVLIDRFSNWHQCEMGGGLTFEVFLKNRTLFDEMENSGLNLKQGYSPGFILFFFLTSTFVPFTDHDLHII